MEDQLGLAEIPTDELATEPTAEPASGTTAATTPTDDVNAENWKAANTQRAQALAEEKRQLESERQMFLQQKQAFETDPRIKDIRMAQEALNANPQLEQQWNSFWAGQGPQPATQSGVTPQVALEIQRLKDQQNQILWQQQQSHQKAEELDIRREIAEFRENHPDLDDAGYKEFENWYKSDNPGVAKLEDAFWLKERDTLLARAREEGRTTVAEGEAAATAAQSVAPGAHEPETFEGDPLDRDFEGSRERAFQSGVDLGGSLT